MGLVASLLTILSTAEYQVGDTIEVGYRWWGIAVFTVGGMSLSGVALAFHRHFEGELIVGLLGVSCLAVFVAPLMATAYVRVGPTRFQRRDYSRLSFPAENDFEYADVVGAVHFYERRVGSRPAKSTRREMLRLFLEGGGEEMVPLDNPLVRIVEPHLIRHLGAHGVKIEYIDD